jgi:hypothetical protein
MERAERHELGEERNKKEMGRMSRRRVMELP